MALAQKGEDKKSQNMYESMPLTKSIIWIPFGSVQAWIGGRDKWADECGS